MIGKATETARLLVVSHDAALLRPLWLIGESNDWHLESAGNAWEAIERVQSGLTPSLLLLDLPQGDTDGLHILRWLRRLRPALPIVLIGYPGDAARRQEAIRMGARDYLTKPLHERRLELLILQYLCDSGGNADPEITSEDVEAITGENFFIGVSPIMRKLRAQAGLLAEANVPVLIVGESGSGKETAARLLHKLSVRSGFEFAKVNCAALPADLLERELFGHGRDSLNGRTRAGKLELCAKGTIFLEEITEMPLDLQAELLQVLQNSRFTRQGTKSTCEVDVRILGASSESIEQAIAENRFREDLYYRLSAYTIHVPPLRERREEIPLLLRHFMHQLAKHYGLPQREFSPSVTEACLEHSWPGNLDELETFVKRYLMVGDHTVALNQYDGVAEERPVGGPVPSAATKLVTMVPAQSIPGNGHADSLKSLVQSVKLEAERNAIAAALEKTRWNRKAAARLLKVSYRTLLYKIEQYQMKSHDSSLVAGDSARGRNAMLRNGDRKGTSGNQA